MSILSSTVGELVSYEHALSAGLKRFNTGIPCIYGHVAERLTSNRGCIECLRASKLRDYRKNPDRYRACAIKWERANYDHNKAWKAEWYQLNKQQQAEKLKERIQAAPEVFRERSARYRAANRSALLAKKADYYEKNKIRHIEGAKKWRAKNPLARKAIVSRYVANKKGSHGSHTGDDIAFLLKTQGHQCVYCRASLKVKFHVDHIMPLSKGGSNDHKNLQILCVSCNTSKNNKHPIEFAQRRGLLL